MLKHVGAIGALTRLPDSPGSPFSPFCPPEGPCKDKHLLYQHAWLLDLEGLLSVQNNLYQQVHVTLAGRYLQGVPDILDRLVDLELQGHPKENAHEAQSKMMQSDGC